MVNDARPLGDRPIESAFRVLMQTAAGALDQMFNGERRGADRKVGFIIMVFPYGSSDGRCNYISNGADRADVVSLLKEQVRRFEGAPDVEGRA